jgi:hypothetical protein
MLFPNIAVPEQVYKEITARGGKDFLADGIPERKIIQNLCSGHNNFLGYREW